MANSTAADWDITAPADSDSISAGAAEIRVLREAVEDRINKEHVTLAGSTAGGEHLEGSARIHTAASAPTKIVVGGADISGNEALAEGLVWTDTDGGYVCQVYAASAWHSLGYLQFHTGNADAITDTTAGVNIDITGTAGSKGIDVSNASTSSSSFAVYVTNSGAGQGVYVTNTSTGNGVYSLTSGAGYAIQAVAQSGSSTAAMFVQAQSGSGGNAIIVQLDSGSTVSSGMSIAANNDMAHLHLSGDPTVASSNDGDIWFDGTNLYINIDGTEYTFDLTVVP